MTDALVSRILDPERLAALERAAILDTASEEGFDALTRLACAVCRAPVALVSLVDKDRQFFKSCIGLPEPYSSTRETPLTYSFCKHAVMSGKALIIEDASAHPLVRDNPAIAHLGIMAYAGIPLRTREGHVLGTLCVIDRVPRPWSAGEYPAA